MDNSASLIGREKAAFFPFPFLFFFLHAVSIFAYVCMCVSDPWIYKRVQYADVWDRKWVCVVKGVLAEAGLSHWKMKWNVLNARQRSKYLSSGDKHASVSHAPDYMWWRIELIFFNSSYSCLFSFFYSLPSLILSKVFLMMHERCSCSQKANVHIYIYSK